MKRLLTKARAFLCAAIPVALATVAAAPQTANVPRLPIDSSVPVQVQWARRLYPAPAALPLDRILLVLRPDAPRQTALRAYLVALQDPRSPDFHRWLRPAQFGKRFGATADEISQASGWLASQGLRVSRVALGADVIEFSGTAAAVGTAFRTRVARFRSARREFWSNDHPLSVPAELSPLVAGVVSLNNIPRQRRLTVQPYGSPPFHLLVPGDIATLYDFGPLHQMGLDGAGESIAVVGRTDVDPADVARFQSLFLPSYPANPVTTIHDGTDPGFYSQAEFNEAMLDVEWADAEAPAAKILYVTSASTDASDGVDLSAEYAVDHDLAPIMTTSFGDCEADLGSAGNLFYQQLSEQAAAEGITVLVASGDSGAAGCDSYNAPAQNGVAVSGLASSPYVTAVGGTELNDPDPSDYWASSNRTDWSSLLGYTPELAWRESPPGALGATLAGGGGPSSIYSKPAWQTGPNVPDDGARDLPDVSLDAGIHDSYAMCPCAPQPDIPTDNLPFQTFNAAGTSAGSPIWAGLAALIDQHAGGRQGNLNPELYALAQSEPRVLHDITQGSTAVPCVAGSADCGPSGVLYWHGAPAFSAGPGYDLATGLGTPDAAALVNAWPTSPGAATATTLKLSATSFIHGAPVIANVAVSPTASGDVTVAATPAGGGTPLVVGNFALQNGAASGLLAGIPGGRESIVADYSGAPGFASSRSSPVAVTVSPEPSSVSLSATEIPLDGNWTESATLHSGDPMVLRATVVGASGTGEPTGEVTFEQNGMAVPNATLPLNVLGQAELPGGVLDLLPGDYTFGAAYAGDAGFDASASAPLAVHVDHGPTTLAFSSVGAWTTANGRFLSASAKLTANTAVAGPTGSITLSDANGVLATQVLGQPGTGTWAPIPASPETLTAHYSGDQRFAPSDAPALLIDGGGFHFTASQTSQTVPAGATATFQIELVLNAPMQVSQVALSCETIDSFRCSVSPTTAVLDTANPNRSIQVTVTSLAEAEGPPPTSSNWPWMLFLTALAAVSLSTTHRRLRPLALAIVAAAALVSCGGSPSQQQPPPRQTLVDVTGLAGYDASGINLTLNLH